MSWLDRLIGKGVALAPAQRERLEAWRRLPEPRLDVAPSESRFVVVDVESTGLDTSTDRLIAIGAITIENARIDFGQSFYAILRQAESSSRENILVHQIGGTQQREGEDPVEVLLRFLEFAGKAPLAGFHAAFDDVMIRKATDAYLGEPFKRRWIDLAYIAPAVFPAEARGRRNLDGWLDRFGIRVFSRHDAVADALATAQLLLALLPHAPAAKLTRVASMLWDPEATRWLGTK